MDLKGRVESHANIYPDKESAIHGARCDLCLKDLSEDKKNARSWIDKGY